jgi:ketosteroid isomerase-like protein
MEDSGMNARFVIRFLVALLALVHGGCSPASDSVQDTRAADEEAIRQTDLAWSAAQQADGLDGVMPFYLDDAILLPPNNPMAIGKDAIREASATIDSPGFSVSWKPMKVEVAKSGDFAYAIGNFEGTGVDHEGNPIPVKGKYLEIWKKQADASWKVAVDMFSPDSSAGPVFHQE